MTWEASVAVKLGALDLDVEVSGSTDPLAIVGPNGSGKTTLLRILAGAIRPDRGRFSVGGRPLVDVDRGVEVPSEERRMGYVPQGYGLFPHLRAVDNVAFGLVGGRTARRAAANAVLEELGSGHLSNRLPATLSGGERQRVALARALMIDPAMMLLDEPLAALDVTARRLLRAFLAERLRSWQRPAVVVTHDARDVAALSAKVVVIERGRVTQRGTLEELRAAPVSDFVAEFVGLTDAAPKPNQ